jgi:excisionase family DNA binding protein
MTTELPEIMTIIETCNYLRIPRSSLYKLAQEGKIPCQKVGRHWRFRREAIDRWLESFPGQDRVAFLDSTGEIES